MNMKHTLVAAACCLTSLAFSPPASAFCGFFVAKADTELFNDASKVALVRDGNRTVVTMASNYRGDASEFAMVIPVVDVPKRDEIRVIDQKVVDHLDAFTAPRLVEYNDPEPWCGREGDQYRQIEEVIVTSSRRRASSARERRRVLRVKVEAEYEIGEYDIQILSAKESGGLITWLNEEGYKIPTGADKTVSAYLKRDMKFFLSLIHI